MLVFREMLADSGYRDTKLVENIARGFDLMGDFPISREFVDKHTYATLTPVRRPMDEVICKGVYDATIGELEAGWLDGPIDIDSIESQICVHS